MSHSHTFRHAGLYAEQRKDYGVVNLGVGWVRTASKNAHLAFLLISVFTLEAKGYDAGNIVKTFEELRLFLPFAERKHQQDRRDGCPSQCCFVRLKILSAVH